MVPFSLTFLILQAIFAPADFHYFSGEREECEIFFSQSPYDYGKEDYSGCIQQEENDQEDSSEE